VPLDALKENEMWSLFPRPNGKHVVGIKMEWYKARPVAN